MFKAVFWYFVIPIGVIYLLFNLAGDSGKKARGKEEAAEKAEFEKYVSTEKGYREYKVQTKIDLKVDMYTKQVYLKGYVRNTGKKPLKNVRIKFTFFTKAKEGEKRPQFVDLGPVAPGQHKDLNRILYTAGSTSIQYNTEVVAVTF